MSKTMYIQENSYLTDANAVSVLSPVENSGGLGTGQ